MLSIYYFRVRYFRMFRKKILFLAGLVVIALCATLTLTELYAALKLNFESACFKSNQVRFKSGILCVHFCFQAPCDLNSVVCGVKFTKLLEISSAETRVQLHPSPFVSLL